MVLILKCLCVFVCVSVIHPCFSQEQSKYIINKELKPYCDFIDSCNTDPIDYLIGLFDHYDVVMLGERDHRDTTQYELIDKLINDPRFIDRVGNILLETGSSNNTDWGNRVIQTNWASDSLFHLELINLWRNMDYEVIWDKYNFYLLLSQIYKVNKQLEFDQKINLYFTDMPFSWDMINRKEERDFAIGGWIREHSLAINSVNYIHKIIKERRKKALIIYNLPHIMNASVPQHMMAGAIIKRLLPGRVTSVMINWSNWTNEEEYPLFFNGKWDAAFAACGNKSIGFNLKGTIFGKDSICSPGHALGLTYMEETLDGFIFYKPYTDWCLVGATAEAVTPDFLPELRRRCRIVWPDHSEEELDADVEWYLYPKRARKLYNKQQQKQWNKQIKNYYKEK